MRWPRKNDRASIDAGAPRWASATASSTSVDLEPFAAAAESLVGVAVIPVSAARSRSSSALRARPTTGAVVETGRATETVHVPLAHTEGGLTAR